MRYRIAQHSRFYSYTSSSLIVFSRWNYRSSVLWPPHHHLTFKTRRAEYTTHNLLLIRHWLFFSFALDLCLFIFLKRNTESLHSIARFSLGTLRADWWWKKKWDLAFSWSETRLEDHQIQSWKKKDAEIYKSHHPLHAFCVFFFLLFFFFLFSFFSSLFSLLFFLFTFFSSLFFSTLFYSTFFFFPSVLNSFLSSYPFIISLDHCESLPIIHISHS